MLAPQRRLVGRLLARVAGVPGGRGTDPRRELAAIGVAATVVPLVLVGTALASLGEVNKAHAQADAITAAQVHFVLADMAHDTMRGDVLAVTFEETEEGRAKKIAALERDVALFRDLLIDVDAVELPADVMAALGPVRPAQNIYAEHVLAFGRAAAAEPDGARDMVAGIDVEFDALTPAQALVTKAMSRSSDRLQQDALDAERSVRARLIGSAVAALVAMAGFTLLLRGLGGRLGQMLARERGVAELLQRSLLPDRLPEVPGVRLAARYVPGATGTEVGGDWYDVIPLPSGEVGLVMGDAVGHDLAAAANMGQLRNGLRACAAEGADPGEVLQRLNRLCLQQNLGSMATVVYGVLDPVLGRLR